MLLKLPFAYTHCKSNLCQWGKQKGGRLSVFNQTVFTHPHSWLKRGTRRQKPLRGLPHAPASHSTQQDWTELWEQAQHACHTCFALLCFALLCPAFMAFGFLLFCLICLMHLLMLCPCKDSSNLIMQHSRCSACLEAQFADAKADTHAKLPALICLMVRNRTDSNKHSVYIC